MGLMAKAKRYDHGNRMLHVISRSVHEDELFPTDRFARLFWNEVGNRSLEFGVRILAMCLLGNHFHLIMNLPVLKDGVSGVVLMLPPSCARIASSRSSS